MLSSRNTAKISTPTISARIVIGVTGHRKLQNQSELTKQIPRIIKRIKQWIPPLHSTPLVFHILSSLAEGADRLVTHEVLKIPSSQLEVVFPFAKDKYIRDFKGPKSKVAFEGLLSRAHRVLQLPPTTTRTEAYAQAGRYVVDHCDVLVALWDGTYPAAQGGTAETVSYARSQKCPLFWINTDDRARITYEMGRGFNLQQLQDVDQYNSELADTKVIEQRAKDQSRVLLGCASESRLPTNNVQNICERILPHYYRADILALRYQHLYSKAGSLLSVLAAAAVAAAAFQAIFVPNWHRIVLIEVLIITAVFAVFWFGSRQRWHAKWIDYRFLAERFRSALFMAVANINISALRPPRHLSLSYTPQDWMVAAFSSVWSQLPRLHSPGASGFEGVRKFLLAAWIDDQIRYHKDRSERHQRRHRRLLYGGNVLFGFTFVAATLHVLHVVPDLYNHVLAFMAIIFPAFAGALGAIRTHREYRRNAKRSSEMVQHLQELREKMVSVQNPEGFISVVHEVEETLLHENEDWRVVVRFHELEPPA
jgi:nucleoside 2-deoxyribosyltransferase